MEIHDRSRHKMLTVTILRPEGVLRQKDFEQTLNSELAPRCSSHGDPEFETPGISKTYTWKDLAV